MKKIITILLFLTLGLPAFASVEKNAKYTGGTVAALNVGGTGHLETSDTALIFEYSGKKLAIPYTDIQSYEYSKEVARHLGVLPAIFVALLKARQQRHYFHISYRDTNQVQQVAVFEASKDTVRVLRAVLQTRAPQSCGPCYSSEHH